MRAAGLRQEAVNDAVKRHAVVEAVAYELLDAGDMAGSEVRPHLYDDLSLGGVERQRILGVGHGAFSACLNLC